MRILIQISHPAQVHFFKIIAYELKKKGHNVMFALRSKECAKDLLDYYGYDYEIISDKCANGLIKKSIYLLSMEKSLLSIAKKFGADLILSETSYSSHIGFLLRIPTILITQNEHATLDNFLFNPFANIVVSFNSYQGKKLWNYKYKINGYFFLPYLHPKYFTPELDALNELNLSNNEKYAVVRFSSWDAAHDFKKKGFSLTEKENLVEHLAKEYHVFISSEGKIPKKLEKYCLKINAEKFHSVLYYAGIFIGEGGSSAAEAAILGVPSIYYSPLQCGYIEELKEDYGLVYTPKNFTECLNFIDKIKSTTDVYEKWQEKKNLMLDEKEDVPKKLVNLIENIYNEDYLLECESV